AILRALGALHHPPSLVNRYSELTEHAVFYLDPHICLRCRYRSTELLWQCPHCHDWNTFVEERIAPAQVTNEVEVSDRAGRAGRAGKAGWEPRTVVVKESDAQSCVDRRHRDRQELCARRVRYARPARPRT